MNWEAIGAVGEIVGASAVVISIVYLSVQIRQSSRVSKAVAIQSWANAAALEKSALFSDPDLAALILNASVNNVDNDLKDKLRVQTYFTQLFNTFELLFFQRENGTVDNKFFESKATAYLGMMAAPGIRSFWGETRLTHFDERFRLYVDQELRNQDAA